MTIQSFIEKAVEGGWRDYHSLKHVTSAWVAVHLKATCWIEDNEGNPIQAQQTTHFKLEEALLDPLAWQAVGKTEGWFMDYETMPDCDIDVDLACWCKPECNVRDGIPVYVHQDRTYRGYMHSMIDAFAEGKTIEEYLATL